MRIEPAKEGDRDRVLALLQSADLPLAGAGAHLDAFLLALGDDGSLAGCIGLEIYEDVGLLRSLAVRDEHRGSG